MWTLDETQIENNNIYLLICSFALQMSSKINFQLKTENVIFILGNTELAILENIEDIVNKSLPIDKVTNYYKEVKGASRDVVLGYVTFTNEVKNVSTDWNNLHVGSSYSSMHASSNDKLLTLVI